MKKILIIFFFLCYNINSQNKLISIQNEHNTRLNLLKLIEQKTDYTFFYIEDWFNNKELISINFDKKPIKEVLESIFKNSDLNFYFFEENKIILTKNSQIYSSVYESIGKELNSEEKKNPIILSQENLNEYKNKVIKIGKEKANNTNKTYTLKGKVYNNITGDAIAGLVLLQRQNNIYTTTKKDGSYRITLPYGLNIIETLLSGIENANSKFILYGDGVYDFNLGDDVELLDQIIVKSKTNDNVRDPITGVVEIVPEKTKTIPLIFGERDIIKVATSLPGIKSAGEGAEGINVRGGKSDQNLFLLDNSVIYNPNHFLGIFSAINPFVTKNLKIFKGYVPPEYNGRISSVFDIETKNSNTEKVSGEASIGPVTGNISLEIPLSKNKSGLLIAARGTYSDWILKAVNNEDLKNSSASFYDVITKYHYNLNENNTVKFSGYYSKDKFSIASDSTNNYGNRILSLAWNHKFNEKKSGEISLSNSNYFFDIDYEGNTNNNFKINYSIDEVNLKLKMRYLLSNKHKINYGISSKLYNISPSEKIPVGENSIVTPFKSQKEKALESAFFISDEYKINDKLLFNGGLSYNIFSALGESTKRLYADNSPKNESTVIGTVDYDKNEAYKTYTGLSLRFSSRYSLSESLSLKASYNNSYQFIHRLTNNTTSSPTDTWKLSDNNIKPQEATQVSFGIYKNINIDEYELSLETYYKSLKNLLDFKVGANLLLNEFIETEVIQGEGKSYGIELLAKKNTGDFNGWIAYSYSRSLQKFVSPFPVETINGGDYFPSNFDRPHDVNFVTNYKLTKRFSFSLNFNYQSGRPITYPTGKYTVNNTEYLAYSDRNKFRIPDYFRLDLGFNVEGNHKIKKLAHSFWNVSIYNVLGRNNPYTIFFVSENGLVQGYQNSIFANPIPTITYNIKF